MRYMNRLLCSIVCLFASFQVGAEGDPDLGRDQSFTCTGCHSSPGYRNAYPGYTVPKLGGQKMDYLETALKAYRSGARSHKTMHAQIAQLDDEQISNIAAYFSQLTKE